MASLVELKSVGKAFPRGAVEVTALREVSLSITAGESVAVMGPSGSGKSTLLGILGCLDRPTRGQYLLEGLEVSSLPDAQLSALRNRRIGFVFQSFHLIPQLTVAENVETPLLYAGVPEGRWRTRALSCLERVGLLPRAEHRPSELSGGEAHLLADEPTGNLDTATGEEVADVLWGLHREGRTVVVVTHNESLAGRAQRLVRLRDGRIE
ncbi:MAG: macrolide ABC transporter ATP-binding protein [Acidobacteria bacterium]|nr:MAG: macrolide ABC transporter ATP-binding protein [Acidobacteriota bacterium]